MPEVENDLLASIGYDMLIRIDERLNYLSKEVEVNTMDVKNLNSWKNKTVGALTIVSAITGYGLVF